MSVQGQPSNIKFLSPLGFKFVISKLPNLEYFIQSFDFPGINLAQPGVQTPFNKIMVTPDHITFENFSIEFKLDEDLNGYFEIYDWMTGLGFPESFDKSKALLKQPLSSGLGAIVNADLVVQTGTMNSNIKITFNDVMPVALSGFKFNSTSTDVQYITARADFRYRSYEYTRL